MVRLRTVARVSDRAVARFRKEQWLGLVTGMARIRLRTVARVRG